MKPLAFAADAASYGVCMGLMCAGRALAEVVVIPVRLEGGKMGWLGASAARANAGKEGLAMGFLALRHTSVVHAGACLLSETGQPSGSVNETPQVNCPKHKLLRGEPLDDYHGPTTKGTGK